MSYNLETKDGILEIPDGTIIEYKGLEIVGQDKEYWNKPIQQNFIEIADNLQDLQSQKINAADVNTALNAINQKAIDSNTDVNIQLEKLTKKQKLMAFGII